jgi:hypothetical protein
MLLKSLKITHYRDDRIKTEKILRKTGNFPMKTFLSLIKDSNGVLTDFLDLYRGGWQILLP